VLEGEPQERAPKTPEERKRIFDQSVLGLVAQGRHVEYAAEYQAVLVGGERREMLRVDEYGNVTVKPLEPDVTDGWASVRRLSLGAKVATVGSALVIVGALLPWLSFLGEKLYGFRTDDGKLVLVIGGLGLFGVWWRQWRGSQHRGLDALNVLLGVLAVVVAGYDWTQFAAIGLYVLIVGGIVLAAGGVIGVVSAPRPQPDSGPTSIPPDTRDP
jgi:hypothetical protein